MNDPQNYLIASKLLIQGLGLIYFFAFGAFLFQIPGLLGSKGILPVSNYLNHFRNSRLGKKRFYYLPTIFWINDSDKALMGVVYAGTILSCLLIFNILPIVILPLLYILYLSIVTVGQDFLSFGWEGFLLEVTFNSILLTCTPFPNPFVWISLNLVLFRFYFQGGAVKLQSRDPNWRNLTAVAYHYESQPLPNTQAWFFHKLPLGMQKFSTALMFVIEIIIPFFMFINIPEVRLFVFACFLGLQVLIWFTGNFSFLNYLTAVLCIILIPDVYLEHFFSKITPQELPQMVNIILQITVSLIGSALIALQLMNLWNHFFWNNRIFSNWLAHLQPFFLVNRYGIFAVMTTDRIEIVVEGSHDGVEWKEYAFRYKPSEVNRRPRRISPYQPRLDWQAWFLPFSYYESEIWFQNFLVKLLKGESAVLQLLRVNPFPEMPPRYVRALAYRYTFSSFRNKKEQGHWWERTLVSHYSPTLSLAKSGQS